MAYFFEELRAVLRVTDVSVCTVRPGPVRTKFKEVAKRPGGQPEMGSKIFFVSVRQVARAGLAALEADRPVVIPGFAMKFAMFLSQLMPMPVVRLALRLSPGRG